MSRLAKDPAAVAVAAMSIPPPAVRAALSRDLTAAIREAGEAKPCGAPQADPEDWFPLRGDEAPVTAADVQWARAQAQALCGGCPVMAECLEQTLRDGPRRQWGLAGGLCRYDRRAVLRLRSQLEEQEAAEAASAAEELTHSALSPASPVTPFRASTEREVTGDATAA